MGKAGQPRIARIARIGIEFIRDIRVIRGSKSLATDGARMNTD